MASLKALVARIPRPLRPVGLVALGIAIGLAPTLLRDRHAAAPEQLVGTVTFSNQETRHILFQAEGRPRKTREYVVSAVYWTDAAGQSHGRGYPSCLAGQADDPVRSDHRRVELKAIYPTGGEVDMPPLVVAVRCLG